MVSGRPQANRLRSGGRMPDETRSSDFSSPVAERVTLACIASHSRHRSPKLGLARDRARVSCLHKARSSTWPKRQCLREHVAVMSDMT